MNGLFLGLGLSATVRAAAAAAPFSPNVLTASSFWAPTSKTTGADTGLNGAAAPTESATVYGTGYTGKIIGAHTHVYYECAEDDNYYVMFWGSGDWARMGGFTLEITYEGATGTYTNADVQYDPVQGIYGIPVSFRPRAGYSGIARFYAKFIPTNGYERLMSGEIWHNRAGTTNYFDRAANAIYVSGADYNGSGAIGTNTTTVGTSGNPNPTLQRGLSYATTASGRDGCFIYLKGQANEDANGPSRPSGTVLPCQIRPWPGYTRDQTLVTKSSRTVGGDSGGGINWTYNQIEFYNVQINPDNIVRMYCAAANTGRLGMRDCVFAGTLTGGSSFGTSIGLVNSVGSANSQNWAEYSSGQINWMKGCTGTIFSPNGFRKVVNCNINYGWDTVKTDQITAANGGNKDASYWNYKAYGADRAWARFHYTEEMTVTWVSYDANGYAQLTVNNATETPITNLFETHVYVCTGTLAGNLYGTRVGASYDTASNQYPAYGSTGDCAIIAATTTAGFPTANCVYVKGVNLGALGLAIGDKIRVYNHPHKDALQIIAATGGYTSPFIENYYFQSYFNIADDVQPFLNQTGTYAGAGGTVSVSGTALTFSVSQTIQIGMTISLTASKEYARIVSGSGTSWTIDRSLTTVSGASFVFSPPWKDFALENCIVHMTSGGEYLGQWQQSSWNVNIYNCTFPGLASGSGNSIIFRNQSNGFGMTDWTMRQCILGAMTADSGFPTSGITFDYNHFQSGTARGSNGATGDPAYNSTGTHTSGYLPTAATATVPTVYLKYDGKGQTRTVGAKVGARVS